MSSLVIIAQNQVFPPEQEWQRGQATPLHQITGGVCAKVVELLLQFMRKDHETQASLELYLGVDFSRRLVLCMSTLLYVVEPHTRLYAGGWRFFSFD